MNQTFLYSGFPGTGKSYFFNNTDKDLISIIDSDSSTFDKKDFPDNYIRHIKENVGKIDVICISSHKEVRDALVANELYFLLFYPDKSLKAEYLQRYTDRGSPKAFIDLIDSNWDMWLTELEHQRGCKHIVLQSGEYISL